MCYKLLVGINHKTDNIQIHNNTKPEAAKTPMHASFIERKMKIKKSEQTTHTDVTVLPWCVFVHCVTPRTHIIIGIAAVVVNQAFTYMPINTDTEGINHTVVCVCVCERVHVNMYL